MTIGITLRYKNDDFCLSKHFINIFNKLGVTLIPLYYGQKNEDLLDICDGIILTGSYIHVNPSLYNQKEDIKYNFDYDKEDHFDYFLINYFHSNNKFIIGICRGIQILNVYFGGTLKQKISNHEKVKHYVKIYNNSFLKSIYNKDYIIVNSTHTQSIDKLADNFSICAISSDNTIEAISYKNIYAIQWHPEYLYDNDFFQYIIKKETI